MSPATRARTTATAVRGPSFFESAAAGAEARPRRVSFAATRARVAPGAATRARVARRGAVAAASPRHIEPCTILCGCPIDDNSDDETSSVVFSARVGCGLLLGEGHFGHL